MRSRNSTLHPQIIFAAALGLLVFFVFIGLGIPQLAHAQTAFEQFGTSSGLPQQNIITIIARIIRVFLGLLGIIFTVLIIYAGYMYMTAGGDPTKVGKAKQTIQQAVIGLIIIMSSYAIASWVINKLLDGGSQSVATTAIIQKYSEPLASALGVGIIESHFPPRNALDIARNTKIFVQVKAPRDVSSIIQGYADDPTSTKLNTDNVYIYPANKGPESKLKAEEVIVTFDEAHQIFVFKPVDYLGSPTEDTNYRVELEPGIKLGDGTSAFEGVYSGGYDWTFEVGTTIDLTPPKIVSVIPIANSQQPRNITVEITFNEAMDPVASTGKYVAADNKFYTNIEVLDGNDHVEGEFEISNAYKVVGFTTTVACAKDPCGDTIYCLPANKSLNANIKAATLDTNNLPQGLPAGVVYDGLVDAAGNSLDGNGDGKACGSKVDSVACEGGEETDGYVWGFTTTGEINTDIPYVLSSNPPINGGEISQTDPLGISFSSPLKSSTVNSSTVSLWPDPNYPMWFSSTTQTPDVNQNSTILIDHPTLVSAEESGWSYYPVLNQGIKSAYQICMYPSQNGQACNGADSSKPYCCNGAPSATACKTATGATLPITNQ